MKVKCCLPGCKREMNFKFPTSEILKKKWLEAMRTPDMKPKKFHGLCKRHFSEDDLITESFEGGFKLVKNRLKKGAVPSVFPWGNEELATSDVIEIVEVKELVDGVESNINLENVELTEIAENVEIVMEEEEIDDDFNQIRIIDNDKNIKKYSRRKKEINCAKDNL